MLDIKTFSGDVSVEHSGVWSQHPLEGVKYLVSFLVGAILYHFEEQQQSNFNNQSFSFCIYTIAVYCDNIRNLFMQTSKVNKSTLACFDGLAVFISPMDWPC